MTWKLYVSITTSIQSSLAAAQETVLHIGMGAEAESFHLAGLLHLRRPILKGTYFIDVGKAVDEEKIDTGGLKPVQTLI